MVRPAAHHKQNDTPKECHFVYGGGHGTRPSASPVGLRTAFEPEPAERFTESSADGSALTGPSPRDIYKKYNNTQKGVIVFMAEDMGLEPTGLLHLT